MRPNSVVQPVVPKQRAPVLDVTREKLWQVTFPLCRQHDKPLSQLSLNPASKYYQRAQCVLCG